MKKLLLLMMCWPAMLAAQSVSNLIVGTGTVSFGVSWKQGEVSNEKVWVFVDYNKNGVMTRLPVTGAAVTGGGTVETVSDNTNGVWVKNSGDFSGTVTLSFNPGDVGTVAGACAYA
jgi:hypothetical protein